MVNDSTGGDRPSETTERAQESQRSLNRPARSGASTTTKISGVWKIYWQWLAEYSINKMTAATPNSKEVTVDIMCWSMSTLYLSPI